jgi:carbamate kinase
MNDTIIGELARKGSIVIAAGGGGVPVYHDENGDIRTTEAVVDKDMASSLLATQTGLMNSTSLLMFRTFILIIKSPDRR